MKQNKSIIAVILVLLILVSLCACINNNDAEVEDELNTSNISIGVQGVQTRLKRNVRFESK